MQKIHLIAGLPRSGSTLLCNLLNMNPKFHATATSPLLDVIRGIRSIFSHNITYKSHDRLEDMDGIKRATKAFVDNYYDPSKEVIFDKSRGWVTSLTILDEILGNKDTKIIWTYRDPVEIVSSIEKHYNKTIMLENADEANGVDFSTLESRVNIFINDGGLVARPVWALNDAFDVGYSDRILIIRYGDLTLNPQETLDRIHDFLGLEQYQYSQNDFKDLKQTTNEFDGIYNYKFPHTIKEGEVKYVKHESLLPQHMIEKINARFSWVNELVKELYK
jgi:sulfotransferase